MHALITGHTGFKGAWLTVLLKELGHTISGISLDPEPGALYERAELSRLLEHDLRLDIRDPEAVRGAFRLVEPDVILHLAAQPLVRRSYREPRLTYETNVMGTYNVLEAASGVSALKALVMVTTDKVYRNVNRAEGYREDEPLGGDDPYSASKAMADLLTQSWVSSFPGVPTAIVRGGNVIGGGDVSADRLLVDLIRGFTIGEPISIRYPEAVRPWQHVLDCLSGYLAVTAALLHGGGTGAWNIGPDERSFVSVREIADAAVALWGADASWEDVSQSANPHEAGLLALDASKARVELNWRDQISYPDSLIWTLDWSRRVLAAGEDPYLVTVEQVRRFLDGEARGGAL